MNINYSAMSKFENMSNLVAEARHVAKHGGHCLKLNVTHLLNAEFDMKPDVENADIKA